MKTGLVVWWTLLHYSCFIFGQAVDWNDLKNKLEGPYSYSVGGEIARKWNERPLDFFQDLKAWTWMYVEFSLSVAQIRTIRLEEFSLMSLGLITEVLATEKARSAFKWSCWSEKGLQFASAMRLYELLIKTEIESPPPKLGNHWDNIPPFVIFDFTRKKKYPWKFIHPKDQSLVLDSIGRAIPSFPQICANLKGSFWTEETIRYVTSDCLYEIPKEKKKPVKLGKLWTGIRSETIKNIDPQRLNFLRNVSESDFEYMPSSLLKLLFSSPKVLDCLPQPSTNIVLSLQAFGVDIEPRQFAKIVNPAPGVAAQLLWYSRGLSEDVLSYCSASDIIGLELIRPGKAEPLDWVNFFGELQKRHYLAGTIDHFNRMIQLASENGYAHFCCAISDVDEYLSLTWLHSNMSERCLLALGFNPDYIFNFLSNLELAKESFTWERILESYSLENWSWFSQSDRINVILGTKCGFWRALDSGVQAKVLEVLNRDIFKRIIPDCVLNLGNVLRQNARMIKLLADDAFSKHQISQLPCRLKDLSPTQISHFSKWNFHCKSETCQKGTFSLTAEDLKGLDLKQFKSLYRFQWDFVPDELKSVALSWQIEASESRILTKGLMAVKEIFELILEIYKDGYQKIPNSSLLSLIHFVKNSNLREIAVESSLLEPAIIISLVRNAKELRDYNRKAFAKLSGVQEKLVILNDPRFGFDRSAIIEIIKRTPELFAAPGTLINTQGVIDDGGVIRIITSQLLSDIQRDLIIPYLNLKLAKEIQMDNTVLALDSMEINDDRIVDLGGVTFINKGSSNGIMRSETGNGKFVWGISKETGLIVGLVFGKALQLDIRLPFALSSEFYNLLIDNSDEAIERYYNEAYWREISEFEQNVIGLFVNGKLEELLDILPRPESLYFTKLSVESDREKAKNDKTTKTNLYGCGCYDDCYKDIKELQIEGFAENYIRIVLEKTRDEFKGFIRELIKGLGMVIPSVGKFNSLPLPIVGPFVEFLPELLNPRPILGENVLARVRFGGEYKVRSIIRGETIGAKEVFSAFVLSLESKQLEHLLAIWTGASTLLLDYSELTVVFMETDNVDSYQVNFYNPANPSMYKKDDGSIAPCEEYLAFFKKFSQRLLGASVEVKPGIASGIIPVAPLICAKSLMIYLQSAEQIFNSLVDLLYTPLTTLWDN